MKPLRNLLKHSSVYMIGQILTRLASVLLLPFYTGLLEPADYGVVGMLDLTAAILSTFIAGGMVAAVTRHHFDNDDARQQDRVWWTGLTMVVVVATLISTVLILGRQTLANLTLPDVVDGPYFYVLAILTMWLTVISMILDAYLRVQKRSGTFVVIAMSRLLINIGLNVYLMAGLKMGVEGLLVGNLVASLMHALALLVVFLKTRGYFTIDKVIGSEMVRFASPLVLTALASMLIHEMDRYFVLWWGNGQLNNSDMDAVGIYVFAHKIGFAVNTLVLLPFTSIWHVAIYEIERMKNANEVFEKIFGYFTSGVGILLLGAALTVHPILPLVTRDAYGASLDLIAGVLLGFYFFGLSFMFEVPSLLHKKTRLMIPGSVVGLAINIVANAWLVPKYSSWGAAWAGVLTYIGYSFCVLYYCRKVTVYRYNWFRFCATTIACCGAYVGLRYGVFPSISAWAQVAVSVLVCGLLAVLFFGREGLEALNEFIEARRNRTAKSQPVSTGKGEAKIDLPRKKLAGAS